MKALQWAKNKWVITIVSTLIALGTGIPQQVVQPAITCAVQMIPAAAAPAEAPLTLDE